MIDYVSSIEEFINLYLEAKNFENTQYEENKHFYFDKNSKQLFLYDIYSSSNNENFGKFVEQGETLNELNGIEFDSIEFLILVESIEQKYLLPNNIFFKKKLSSIKTKIARYLHERTGRHIKESYEFIAIPNKIETLEIKIQDRFRATQANALTEPRTEGLVFTANLFDIVNLYNKIGDSLFKENLRIGLDKKQDLLEVTTEIIETLQYNPEEFWFLNNGITIIADQSTLDLTANDELKLKDLYNDNHNRWNISVINGAQTITAASKFFFDDNKRKDKKFFEEILNNNNLDSFVEEFIKFCPNSLKVKIDIFKIKLKEYIKANLQLKSFDFKKFLETFCNENNIGIADKELIVKIKTNIFSINNAKSKSDVLLRIIYYSDDNQSKVSEITNKITVALNRQKPMRMEDISLASLFVQNINNYYALKMDNRFSIIRRGEVESEDFKSYSLENVMRMLTIISKKNPGLFGSQKKSEQLEKTSKKGSLIIFDEDSIFNGLFNEKSILEQMKKEEETVHAAQKVSELIEELEEAEVPEECPKEFQEYFESNYSFLNSAIKMDRIINENIKEIAKILKNEDLEKFKKHHNSLNGKFKIDKELEGVEIQSLKAIVTYGSDYILACWFYQCWLHSLLNEQILEDFSREVIKEKIDFSNINYSHPIFEGEFITNNEESIEIKKDNYKQLFFKFLIRLAIRWEASSFGAKSKYEKNGFKSSESFKFVNEFLENDLSLL
ncbi:hypothetical protein MTP04_30000 [Lysinibacillus sp. PLM2]|nr:hypothetical protein MTP04_30000 [Lysinibacillus sp. PLM2]